MDYSEIVEQLYLIITELNSRESSGNCTTRMGATGWEDLCDIGINLFERLKHEESEGEEGS